jgi:hypothetical protein
LLTQTKTVPSLRRADDGHTFVSYLRNGDMALSMTSVKVDVPHEWHSGLSAFQDDGPERDRMHASLIVGRAEEQLQLQRRLVMGKGGTPVKTQELAETSAIVMLGRDGVAAIRSTVVTDPGRIARLALDTLNLQEDHEHALLTFTQHAVDTPFVIVEQSPPLAKSLVTLMGTGAGSIVTAASGDPMILVYSLGFLVIVRVVDPLLTVLGKRIVQRLDPDDD